MPDVQVGPAPRRRCASASSSTTSTSGGSPASRGSSWSTTSSSGPRAARTAPSTASRGGCKYRDITVTRVLDRSTPGLLTWFTDTRKKQSDALKTGRITAYDVNEELVAAWHLTGVWPLRYTGPTFDASAPGLPARETLDLAHGGFRLDRSPS